MFILLCSVELVPVEAMVHYLRRRHSGLECVRCTPTQCWLLLTRPFLEPLPVPLHRVSFRI
jgi:hypothetical protein